MEYGPEYKSDCSYLNFMIDSRSRPGMLPPRRTRPCSTACLFPFVGKFQYLLLAKLKCPVFLARDMSGLSETTSRRRGFSTARPRRVLLSARAVP